MLWDIVKNRKFLSLRAFSGLDFYNDAYCGDFHHSGKLFAVAGRRQIYLWNLLGQKYKSLTLKDINRINVCRFGNSSNLLAFGGTDEIITLWDVKKGTIVKKFKGHKGEIVCLKFNKNDSLLLSAGKDNKIILWDIKKKKKLKVFTGHTSTILDCDFIDNNNYISCSSIAIKTWKINFPPKPIALPKRRSEVFYCGFSKDSKITISVNLVSQGIDFWDSKTGEKLFFKKLAVFPLARCGVLSADNSKLFAALDKAGLHMYDMQTEKKLVSFQGSERPFICALSPDETRGIVAAEDKHLYIWDTTLSGPVKKRKPLVIYKGHSDVISDMVLNRSGTKIASVCRKGEVKIWEIFHSKQAKEQDAQEVIYTNSARSCDFSPDGKLLIFGGINDAITLRDIIKKKDIAVFSGHKGDVEICRFSFDGKRIISAGCDKVIKIWSIETKKTLLTLEGHKEDIRALAISPDNRFIVSGDKGGYVKIWDCEKELAKKE